MVNRELILTLTSLKGRRFSREGNFNAQLQEVVAYCTKLNDHVCACVLTVNLLGALRHRRLVTRDMPRHGCRAQDGRTQSAL